MSTKRDRSEYMKKWRLTEAGRRHEDRRNAKRREARRANPDIQRNHKLRHRYGITLGQYNEMLNRQGGACGWCGDKGSPMHVDHDHETGMVRDLLCHACNLALGFLYESPDRTKALANYIRKWKP